MADQTGITKQHAQHVAMLPVWERIRDAVAGEDAIKAKGAMYLPELGGQAERVTGSAAEDYDNYKARAVWYGATGRTVTGLLGAVFRKPPDIQNVPPALQPRLDNVDLVGTPLTTFLRNATTEVLTVGRYGILVDALAGAGAPTPSLIGWKAEQIRNWRVVIRKGLPVLDQVILLEDIQVPNPDGFGAQASNQYRIHELDEDGLYRVRVYPLDASGQPTADPKVYEPRMRAKRLDFVPFVFLGALNLEPAVGKSPILDLVDMNIKHYLNSADLEWGRHFTALPTPWVITSIEKGTWPLGPTCVWELPLGSEVGMLEFTGTGLASLERAMEEKEKKMAMLGARLLEEQKRAAEAAETQRLRQAGESATLASTVNNVSEGTTKALGWFVTWAGGKGEDVVAQLNKDFVDVRLSAADAEKFMHVWQAGGMSQDSYLHLLKGGEVLPPERTVEEEIELIEQEAVAQDVAALERGKEGKGKGEGAGDEEPEDEDDNDDE
jgi:hypothetical protein